MTMKNDDKGYGMVKLPPNNWKLVNAFGIVISTRKAPPFII